MEKIKAAHWILSHLTTNEITGSRSSYMDDAGEVKRVSSQADKFDYKYPEVSFNALMSLNSEIESRYLIEARDTLITNRHIDIVEAVGNDLIIKMNYEGRQALENNFYSEKVKKKFYEKSQFWGYIILAILFLAIGIVTCVRPH